MGINAPRSRYIKAVLGTATGDVETVIPPGNAHTGWIFQTPTSGEAHTRSSPQWLAPSPTLCASRWCELSFLQKNDPNATVHPSAGFRTGFEKINQVLVGELADQLGERPQSSSCSRTRAKMPPSSAGVGIRHYQDLIRSVFVEEMHALKPFDSTTIQRARDWYTCASSGDDERAAAAELRERCGQRRSPVARYLGDGGDPAKRPLDRRANPPADHSKVQLRVQQELLGVNPRTLSPLSGNLFRRSPGPRYTTSPLPPFWIGAIISPGAGRPAAQHPEQRTR